MRGRASQAMRPHPSKLRRRIHAAQGPANPHTPTPDRLPVAYEELEAGTRAGKGQSQSQSQSQSQNSEFDFNLNLNLNFYSNLYFNFKLNSY
jgi:hypothetical protein